jgi:protease stability complex PrcB-like protein
MLVLIALALAQGVAPLATVAKGAMSNIEEPRQVVVRTDAEWQALWKQHDGNSATPTVDFTQSMVAAVFLGSRPTTGYAADITGMKTEGTRTFVEYLERQPPRDALVAQVLTSPFHIVRIARTAGSVEFRRLSK